MMALLWRPMPVMTLTIRQFTGGRAVRVVAALSFLPALFALIYLLNPDAEDRVTFLRDVIFNELFFPTLLPTTNLLILLIWSIWSVVLYRLFRAFSGRDGLSWMLAATAMLTMPVASLGFQIYP